MAALVAVTRAGRYVAAAWALPDQSASQMPAGATVEIRLSVPVGTYLLGLTGSSSDAAGFEVQITDARHGAPLWSAPVDWRNATSQAAGPGNAEFPMMMLDAPRLVIEPGLLNIRIRNLATTSNSVQLILFCAEPQE
jgi:hypothetical protein